MAWPLAKLSEMNLAIVGVLVLQNVYLGIFFSTWGQNDLIIYYVKFITQKRS